MTTYNGLLFTLKSAAMAAAWNDNLQLEIIGYRSNTVIINRTFTLQVFEVTYPNFNGFSQLDSLVFKSFGGTKNVRTVAGQNGSHFAMDDICLSFE